MKKDNFNISIGSFMSGLQDTIMVHQDMPEGFMELTGYYILPGMYLIFNDIHTHTVPCNQELMPDDIFLINYCLEGRCEFKIDEDNYSYLNQNLMSISAQPAQDNFYYPSSIYQGYEVYVLPSRFTQETLDTLKLFEIDHHKLLQVYEKGNVFYMSDRILKLWNHIIDSCNSVNIGEIRLHILLLLKYLHDDCPVTSVDMLYLSKAQTLLAKKAKEMLTADLSQHISMKTVSEQLNVSETSLKRYFRSVYGANISTFMNEARMEYAAKLLSTSELSISDIAKACGYVNQGRFASIFRDYYGMKPFDYRRMAGISEADMK